MRVADVLYFSPRFKYSDLDLDDTKKLVEALRDRLMGFYLSPASRLLEAGDAFAAGLLCCTAIDFVALCSGDEHPEMWLRKNIPEFDGDEDLAGKFWKRFRNGLVHEGRIKAFGQFSLDFPNLLNVVGPVLIVNPRLLLKAVQESCLSFFENLDENRCAHLVKRLQRYFRAEIAAAKK